jgi:hypothetical protein
MSSANTALADKRTPIATPRREAHTLVALIEHALSEWFENWNLLNT